jgi:hypothetical protein
VCVLGYLNILLQAANNLEANKGARQDDMSTCMMLYKKMSSHMTYQVHGTKFTSYLAYRQSVNILCRKIIHLLSGLYCTNIVMELPHCRKTLAAS